MENRPNSRVKHIIVANLLGQVLCLPILTGSLYSYLLSHFNTQVAKIVLWLYVVIVALFLLIVVHNSFKFFFPKRKW